MASKRMFDVDLLKRDEFIDLPAEAKALYFILGIEADDEGFINPKIPMRVHLFSMDTLKLLLAKNLIIPFESGVVVITDWFTNNWLDKRRLKQTVFLNEKKSLIIEDNRYMLSGGLAVAKQMLRENSIEESSIEESSISDTEVSDSSKVAKKYTTVKTLKNDRDLIIKKLEELYPDKIADKAFDNFIEQNEIKNYKYKDFYLALCKWVREDRFGKYSKNIF